MRQAVRVLDIVTKQTRALRRRDLIEEFQRASVPEAGRSMRAVAGAYWGITTEIAGNSCQS